MALAFAVLVHAWPAAGVAADAAYPAKPLRWIVGTSPGGGTDVLTRTVGAQLSQQLGQTVLVENRPGGGTTIAADTVARAPADGHTLLSADNGTLIFNTALFKKLPYDPKQDFVPVSMLAEFPLFVAVNPASGYDSMAGLVEAARERPGSINYASAGIGSPHQLAMEMLKDRAGLDLVHVAYKGAAPAIQDVLGGHIPVVVTDAASGMQMLKEGRLKPLAVFSQQRHPLFPDVPTLMELGYTDMPASAWVGLVVPAGTPAGVVARLSAEVQRAIATPEVRQKIEGFGLVALGEGEAQMARYLNDDSAYWVKLIRDNGITVE